MLFKIANRCTARLCFRHRALSSRVATKDNKDIVAKKRVIFSGIQPTGAPHLGNYLGAIKKWVELQKEPGDIYYSVVDLHALTVSKNDNINDRVLDTTACLIAFGIDPERSTIFRQSDVSEHGLLSWALSCLVQQNTMRHLIQWKEKSKADRSAGNLGLFTYPVLQAADILLYKATHVPVGSDQKQHLELCQLVANTFNRRYGDYFPVPEYLSDRNSTKVRSLRDPFSKMSKTEFSDQGKINLIDSDDTIRDKIKRAVTDNVSAVTYDPVRRPGVSNLIVIHSAVTGMTFQKILNFAQLDKLDTGRYKMVVTEAVIDHLRPLRTEYERLKSETGYLNDVLTLGGEKAKETAVKNWADIAKLLRLR